MSSSERNRLVTRVHPDEDGMMVKEIIYGRLNLSRGMLRRMKQGGGVFLNGKRDFITRRVRAGDVIEVVFFDEKTALVGESIPLHVVYEDDFLLAVDKPPGMPVHPTGTYSRGTLAQGLAHYFEQQGLSTKVRLVHRLDKDTSGLVLVAKEPYTLENLIRQRASGRLKREYLAVVEGSMLHDEGTIALPIGRVEGSGIRRGYVPTGKPARTQYEVIRRGRNWSLVRLTLATGRTHQIRVHMEAIGHPLVGDAVYGRPAQDCPRQALHAWRLSFVHPRTGEDVNLRVPIPHDMRLLLQQEILILM
ncbi:MAG: RluA family pseudouridine synthase [Firmicutes bacterium]|jgi:23S rRNA pseudouridine1911/1915/1917 synthase|nr:RluA family pseudouridine synthase [Bacillota bacterium]